MHEYVEEAGGSWVDELKVDGIDRAYILRNQSLERILFNRNLVGLEFSRACEDASCAFLSHFATEIKSLGDDIAELMILTKGLYARMYNAYARVFDENLDLNLVVTKRVHVTSDKAQIAIPHCDFSAPARNLIVADLIASGSSICAALSRYKEKYALDSVFVFSLAGTVVGGQALANFCKTNDIELTLAYGLAAFGLGENGFDLTFQHPDTITRDEYRTRAREMFGDKPVSAVGWDFGSQAQSPRKYRSLCWIESENLNLDPESNPLGLRERPNDMALVEKEASAYGGRDELQRLLEQDMVMVTNSQN